MPVARISPSPSQALEDALIQISDNVIDSDIFKIAVKEFLELHRSPQQRQDNLDESCSNT